MIIFNDVGEKQIVVQLGETEDQIIRQMADLALENNEGNITKAAKALGLNRSCLQMRLKVWREDAKATQPDQRDTPGLRGNREGDHQDLPKRDLPSSG